MPDARPGTPFVNKPGIPTTYRLTTWWISYSSGVRSHGKITGTLISARDGVGRPQIWAELVRTVIHRVRVEYSSFRTATTDLEVRNIDGGRIWTMASWVLDELNAQEDV